MGGEVNIRDMINEKTIKYGIGELNALKMNIQEQLYNLEKFFYELLAEQRTIREKGKKLSKLNVVKVVAGSKVPRSTIYANPNTLALYIEERIKEIEEDDLLRVREMERLKTEKRELIDCFQGLKLNIIDNQVLLYKINELESELKSVCGERDALSKEMLKIRNNNIKLIREINELKQSKVVQLRSGK
ncbi:hypothetical protein IMZ08_19325 [Bacillus luteolus]|uniref:Uncharacterized protein n=1 Tax=Litchfieldia luteola TaxID=682179 RepID=A0ABR9QNW4_9BACI|nr:hypothetical protein [Cytobacillus luteolus]MBE4910193.1 hypothetical protein [Cytobacillus luteolus]MBP1942238.1 hypothetical protein [Cytobacillus luteolus]